jgi:predicted porin
MKKRYLAALPIGLCLSAGAYAQSSVVLYGIVDTGIQYVSNEKGGRFIGLNEGTWSGERFGLRGSEDLGGGTSAIFQLEAGYSSDTGALSKGLMFGRGAWVGLNNNNVGTLTLGRQYSPYYTFLVSNGPTPWLTGQMGAHPGDLDNMDSDYRVNNAVVYKSPTIGGVTLGAMYALGGQAGNFSLGQSWSFAASYAAGPFGIAAAIERFNNAMPGGGAWSASSTAYSGQGEQGNTGITAPYQAAAAQQRIAVTTGYKISDQFNVSASYSNVQYIPGVNSGNTSAAIGGNAGFFNTVTFNTGGVVLHYRPVTAWDFAAGYAYTHASASNGTSGANYNQFNLTELYNLSKRTRLYVLEAFQHAGGETLGSNGKPTPATASIAELTASSGRSQFAAMMGIDHSF